MVRLACRAAKDEAWVVKGWFGLVADFGIGRFSYLILARVVVADLVSLLRLAYIAAKDEALVVEEYFVLAAVFEVEAVCSSFQVHPVVDD